MSSEKTLEEAMAKKALARIKTLSHGNGVQPDSVKIIKSNSGLIACEALSHIELTHEVKEERQKGQHPVGEPVENVAALPQIIEKISSGAIKDINMRKALVNVLLTRPDKGFALHAQQFDVPPLNKEFHSFQPCQTCQGKAQMACQTCQGRKLEQCNQCHGRTTVSCNFCRGSGFTKTPDGKEKQCNRCFGKRQIQCPLCQSRGSTPCRKCKGVGTTKCSSCDGAGVFTFITRIFFKMKILFEIDRAALPHPAVKIIENNGSKLVEEGHIKIHGEAVKREDGGLAIQYKTQFPYAELDVGINGKPFKVHMFGYKSKMLKISNFLDQLIEKNYALLQRAADNEGNVIAHIRKASKTKMIGEGLLLSSTMRPKKAMLKLKKKYPFGASNNLIKDIILQSNKALINVSRKSHLIGLGIGLGVTALINAAYFLGPLRNIAENIIGAGTTLTIADFALIPLGGLIALLISKYMATRPLKNALESLIPAQQRGTFKPRDNNSPWPAFAGAIIIFIIIVFLTTLTSTTPPSWLPF